MAKNPMDFLQLLQMEELGRTALENLTPLEYMMRIYNNPAVPPDRRDKMAIAAAPYVHGKIDSGKLGKKEQQEESAKEAGRGKLRPGAAPKLLKKVVVG